MNPCVDGSLRPEELLRHYSDLPERPQVADHASSDRRRHLDRLVPQVPVAGPPVDPPAAGPGVDHAHPRHDRDLAHVIQSYPVRHAAAALKYLPAANRSSSNVTNESLVKQVAERTCRVTAE
jgi:hypothetical protein